MGRKLSFKALTMMDGAIVEVHDKAYDAPIQHCEVKVVYLSTENKFASKGKKQSLIVKEIRLENEEFLYLYDYSGKCVNGEFEVYSLA